jgi:hypothetical protein
VLRPGTTDPELVAPPGFASACEGPSARIAVNQRGVSTSAALTFPMRSRIIQKLFMSEIREFSHAKSESSAFAQSLELGVHRLRYCAKRPAVAPEHHVRRMAHLLRIVACARADAFVARRQWEGSGVFLLEPIGISIAILRIILAAFIRGTTATGEIYEHLRALEAMQ